jgi:hypothetical protein
MGFQIEPGQRTPGHTFALDDSGQLSIDFYIGLSIFLIALIIASTMISGLLVGLQSKTIDYDAVAYRTGVILAEDPGEPNTVFNYITFNETDQWEFIGTDQKDQVRRFGLTLYKSTPRTLGEQKIISFNNSTRYVYPADYRERLIFGTMPYHFNITMKGIDDGKTYISVGDPYGENSSYGYIRRVVLVKTPSSAVVDMSKYYNDTAPGDGKFKVELNYQDLMNSDRAPQYWIEPLKENITISLKNINPGIKKQSMTPALNAIQIEYYLPLTTGEETSGVFPIYPNEIPASISSFPAFFDNSEYINITFPAGYFIPLSIGADVKRIRMNVTYEFDPNTVSLSKNNNIYQYGSTDQEFHPPSLKPAVMEVRIW